MDNDRMTPERKEAIRRLLDDPNSGVRRAVLRQLDSHGAEAIAFLRSIKEGENQSLRSHASWFLSRLKYADPVDEFRGFIRSLQYELETGSLLLNRTVTADLDVGCCCRLLDEMAARCRELMFPPMSAREKCRVINRVLFHEYGFRGNVENYTDPRNSFIGEVLETRRGLPITLSIIYILVAQRCGFTLEPVGPPGHFLVGCFEDKPLFFVDAFARGAFRSSEDIFAQLRKHKIEAKLNYLTPIPVREVLCRSCRNLADHYSIAGDAAKSRLFSGFVNEFEETHQRSIRS